MYVYVCVCVCVCVWCKHLCCAPEPPVQFATALKFHKDDFFTDRDYALNKLAVDPPAQPKWVGNQKGCKDSVPVDFSTVKDLDECAEKCQKQPGCYLFSYSETKSGAAKKTCQWHKTTSWGRCDNVDDNYDSANNVGLFRLRSGTCVQRRISSVQ